MQTRNLINNQWIDADSGATIDVLDPATDERIAVIPSCGAAETRRAIEAAAAALPEWRSWTAEERAVPLRRLAQLMVEHRERLARLMTSEQGKPLSEARGEIDYARSFIAWAAEEGKRVCGETIPASTRDKRILVLRQPVGVAAAITPWNFPSAMITRKMGPALACGCTMVIKPSELTPLSAFALGELAIEAGIPAGVVNIVTGDAPAIGAELCANPTVRKLSFTGSTAVGRILMRQGAENLTRLSLELGGHAPFLVFDDADVEAALSGAMASKFRNTGQTCICANRFYVQDGIYDEFVAGLEAQLGSLRVGRGVDEGVQVGPLINDAAMDKVESQVADARDKGGRVRAGGARVAVAGCANRFYAPTLLEGFTRDMTIATQETFGPVAPVQRFTHESQAIEAANDSEFGLAAYFYSRDASRLMRVAEALEYGVVGANDGAPSTAQAPFGGVKHSGFGREGGRYVMHEYLETKYVSWGL
ncbi:MAG: NAD-dependent succinate-semialdehyde dehydrogenase [Phycisphaeraceae bacterium]|nr:NAD-dependent succinate-semialdehyde dehydrogenase [Phycisphaeraceae bacterium]MCB9848385.1 NAD-dependent succinate-semialdehyde dehydrogenase [Phycisphaeraceae bacterium]